MRAVNFYHVKSGFPGTSRSFGIGVDEHVDVFGVQHAGIIVRRAAGNERNQRNGLPGGIGTDEASGMVELNAGKTSGLVYGVRQMGQTSDVVVGSNADAGEVAAARIMDAGRFQHVQSYAAEGAGFMVADELFTDFTVSSGIVRYHRRHDDAVAERGAADGQRGNDADGRHELSCVLYVNPFCGSALRRGRARGAPAESVPA